MTRFKDYPIMSPRFIKIQSSLDPKSLLSNLAKLESYRLEKFSIQIHPSKFLLFRRPRKKSADSLSYSKTQTKMPLVLILSWQKKLCAWAKNKTQVCGLKLPKLALYLRTCGKWYHQAALCKALRTVLLRFLSGGCKLVSPRVKLASNTTFQKRSWPAGITCWTNRPSQCNINYKESITSRLAPRR